jgi:hypothetical protein
MKEPPLATPEHTEIEVVTGWRSVGRAGSAVRVNTKNYHYYYLCRQVENDGTSVSPSIVGNRCKVREQRRRLTPIKRNLPQAALAWFLETHDGDIISFRYQRGRVFVLRRAGKLAIPCPS